MVRKDIHPTHKSSLRSSESRDWGHLFGGDLGHRSKGVGKQEREKSQRRGVLASRSPLCTTGPVLLGTLRNMETVLRMVPGKEGRPAGSPRDLQPSLCSLQSLTSLQPRTGIGFGGGREGRAERPQGMPPAPAGTARPRPVSQGVTGQGTAHGMYQLWDGPGAGGDGGDPGRWL